MTSSTYLSPSTGPAWLLIRADELDAAGEHDLAREARLEAAGLPTPAAPVVASLPCDNCGRPVSLAAMPDDWPYDWWSHTAATGRVCTKVGA